MYTSYCISGKTRLTAFTITTSVVQAFGASALAHVSLNEARSAHHRGVPFFGEAVTALSALTGAAGNAMAAGKTNWR